MAILSPFSMVFDKYPRIRQSKGRWLVVAGHLDAIGNLCHGADGNDEACWKFVVLAVLMCRSSDQCLITLKKGQKQNWPGTGLEGSTDGMPCQHICISHSFPIISPWTNETIDKHRQAIYGLFEG